MLFFKTEHKLHEIQDCDGYQPYRIFLEEELTVTIMLDTQGIAEAVGFRAKLGISQYDPIINKQQSVGSKIKKEFKRRNNRIMFCFKQKKWFVFCWA